MHPAGMLPSSQSWSSWSRDTLVDMPAPVNEYKRAISNQRDTPWTSNLEGRHISAHDSAECPAKRR